MEEGAAQSIGLRPTAPTCTVWGMANTTQGDTVARSNRVVIPETYTYEAPSGQVFTGDTAYVLNAIDAAEAALWAKDKDQGGLGEKEQVVFEALGKLIDRAQTLAEHL